MGFPAWPAHPNILEVNAWTWLEELSRDAGEPVTLGNVPDSALDDEITNFDAVWLMGAWTRSAESKRIATEHPGLRREYERALPDFLDDQVIGSPYAIGAHEIEPRLGGRKELVALRERLHKRQVRLVLDFVPNHVAVDHEWTRRRPDYFIHKDTTVDGGDERFFLAGDVMMAHGKDPFFPPWTDTAQLDALSGPYRRDAVSVLDDIANLSDGARCDMAMLLENDIFKNTWGDLAGDVPSTQFWEEVIPPIKERYPNFIFIGEVYWDTQWKLMELGFDFCHDDRLRDRLVSGIDVKGHLRADWAYQSKLMRYIENHDEQRAASIFGSERAVAAASIALTAPGAHLVHEGQTKGHEICLPVQLGTRPCEEDNPAVSHFYKKIIPRLPYWSANEGSWHLLDAMPANDNVIALCWIYPAFISLVVVNYSAAKFEGTIDPAGLLPLQEGTRWVFNELMGDVTFVLTRERINDGDLFVSLAPWQVKVYKIFVM